MEKDNIPDKDQFKKLNDKMHLKDPQDLIEYYKLEKKDPNLSIVDIKEKLKANQVN